MPLEFRHLGAARRVAAFAVRPPLAVGLAVAGASLALSAPSLAQSQQIRTQAQPIVPGTRFDPPPGAVVNDPNRVFGDEAPVFAPLQVVGALGLRPFASLVTEYDNNLARLADGEALPSRFQSKSDWIFRPSIGVSAERPLGQQRLFASVSLGRTFHARNTQLDSNRINLGGGLGFVLGTRCGGQLSAGYSKRDSLISGFEDATSATDESTTFGSSLSCSTNTGLTGSIGYNRNQRRNSTDDPSIDRSFADANGQSVSGSIGYRLGSRGQVGVTAGWSENIYPNQLVLGQENSNEIKNLGLFASYSIGSTLRASGSIGRTVVSSRLPGTEDFSGGTWNLGLGYSGNRFGANVSTGQSVQAGGGQSANYSIVRNFALSGSYSLNDSMGLSAGYAHVNQDFRGTPLFPDTTRLSSSNTDRVFVGANYSLSRLASFSLDLNHQRRSTVPDSFGFKSTSIIFGIRTRF
jgi:hypothetical protein